MERQKTIEEFRSARKGDDDTVVVEGVHAFKHALRFGAAFQDVFVSDKAMVIDLAEKIASRREAEAIDQMATEIDTSLFEALAPKASRTGIVARAKKSKDDCVKELPDQEKPIIFLEEPHDTQNVGAVVRVAAGYGAAAVVVSGSINPWHADCIRSAAGLHWALPVCHVDSIEEIAFERHIISCNADGTDMYSTNVPKNAILVFGTERYGITEELKKRSDHVIAIPMQKNVSSLNLATSVSAVLFGAQFEK